MNRESSLEMVLGITIGLIVIAIAAYRSGKVPSPGVVGRGAAIGLLSYALLAAPIFTHHGMTLIGLIALLVMIGLALWGSGLATKRVAPKTTAASVLRMIAAIGFASALLIAAAQTLSLLGNVDPRVLVVVLLVAVGFMVAGQGLVASSRISSTAMWFMLVPMLLALALGVFLGSPKVAVAPIREVEPFPIWGMICGFIAVFALSWIDGSLARDRASSDWSTKRSAIWAIVVGLIFGWGQLMLFGGAVFAPSMEFFVVPANVDMLPYLVTVLLAVGTVILAAFIARSFASIGVIGLDLAGGAAAQSADDVAEGELDAPRYAVSNKWVWIGGVIAAIIALLGAPMTWVLAVAAIAAILVIIMSFTSNAEDAVAPAPKATPAEADATS